MSGWAMWLRSSWTLSSNQSRNSWASCWEFPLNWRALLDTTFCRTKDKQVKSPKAAYFLLQCTDYRSCPPGPTPPTTTTTFMKYSAGLTRMTVISTIGKVSKAGWGEREAEARRKLFKTRERRGRRIDCLTSPPISWQGRKQRVLCWFARAGSRQVTSAGYQMSRTLKDMRGLYTVCLHRPPRGTFFLDSEALPEQRQHK